MVGLLAGSLLFSTNTADAATTTGNSQTTSEAQSSVIYKWQSPVNILSNYNLNDKAIQNIINNELLALKPMILKELQAAQNQQVAQKPVAQKPVEQKPVAQKPVAQKPVAQKPVAQKPVEQKPVAQKPVTQKPSTSVQQPVTENKQDVKVGSVIQQVVDLTNKERTNAGLKPLQIDAKLTQSAQAKSQDMKNKNYFSHTSPTYGSPFDQMKSFGVSYKSAAENIAMGQRSAAEVVDAWMKSPGHRANIMNPSYTHIGVGLSDSGYYWTQQFIGK
ncbi:hypothetical protein FG384_06260 [Psychrobacillus vulpis]|uniref:SCP domain-containing protein n=2 Tax=Psychrobacillus vulpis TaxID=2325572 RepID=A0A544TTM4_9BACI|nr:hypothetical protein FG384_06260 [Psychrobacillus vulpis]